MLDIHLASSIQHRAMAIKLTYRGETSVPVEIEGLTPDWACDKSLAEIERFEIFHGNRKIPLAEMFTVSGDAADKRLDFEGNLSGVHWIGAHMRTGQVYVHGAAGRHVGSEMRGGEIRVEGDAGGWAGCEMRGGLIHVQGNAGHLVGAAYRGSAKGMMGGTILVAGDAGNEIGLSMQQGTIAIGGAAGDMLGFNMTDGTVFVLGDCGIRAGAGMHGGTIALLGPTPPPVLPSFRFDRTTNPAKLVLTLRDLNDAGLQFDAARLPAETDVYVGDQVADGNGEIYLRHVDGS
jgi:formylmethanofuran dehydrogenase subunit C